MINVLYTAKHWVQCQNINTALVLMVYHGGGLVPKSCLTLETPWTVTHQVPLSMGFPKLEILKWVAISFSRVSSQPRNGTQVSCIAGELLQNCRQILYQLI